MNFENYGVEPLAPQDAASLRDHLWRRGDVDESKRLGISRLALVRAAAGLPVQRRVRVIVRTVLGEAA